MASPLVQFRLPEEDAARLEQAHKRRGMTKADWLRMVVRAAMASELGEKRAPNRRSADPYDALRDRVSG